MERAPHPSSSLDLAPCDFSFLGDIKGRLAGASFEEFDQLLQVIDATEKAILEHMFQEWMNKLAQYCVAVGGLGEGMEKSLRPTQVLLDSFRDANQPPPTPYILKVNFPSLWRC
jgi:hypothetical protein